MIMEWQNILEVERNKNGHFIMNKKIRFCMWWHIIKKLIKKGLANTMKKNNEFYKNTLNALPHDNIKEFIQMEKNVGDAIDLGCGAGRDSIYLLNNNWKVLAIDKENLEEVIKDRLNEKQLANFDFLQSKFENMQLKENDLTVANYSIPFCNKNQFQSLWSNISKNIKENRIFCGEFFGRKRLMEWNKRRYDFFEKRSS